MNKRKYFDLVFYIAGSFIVLAVTITITVNFFRDSRFLGKTAPVVVKVEDTKKPVPNTQTVVVQPDIKDTHVYKRKPDAVTSNKPDSTTQKPVETTMAGNPPLLLRLHQTWI